MRKEADRKYPACKALFAMSEDEIAKLSTERDVFEKVENVR